MKFLLFAAALVACAVPAANAAYPKPPAHNLAKPFTGRPVPGVWFGKWRETGTSNDGVVWQFFARTTPACKALVAGRTTCFVLRPPGTTWIDGGAVTLNRSHVVFRMTYRGHPNTVGCFADDAYAYRVLPTRILITKGSRKSCFWEAAEHFPIHLNSVR